MKLSKKDEALRMSAKFMMTLHHKLARKMPFGGGDVATGLKFHAELCAIALPNKLRFTREELDEMIGGYCNCCHCREMKCPRGTVNTKHCKCAGGSE